MKYLYIDLGCNDGKSVEEFRNWSKLAFPHAKEWQIAAFDPNPNFKNQWANIANIKTHFYEQAAWTHDGNARFAVDPEPESLGSTLMEGKKKTWENSKKITVETFDFPSYLQRFADSFVVVKMDIEGAEFPLLQKLLDTGAIDCIDVLLVEFHPNKVVEYTTTDKNNLLKTLKDRGVYVLEWH